MAEAVVLQQYDLPANNESSQDGTVRCAKYVELGTGGDESVT